MRLAKPYESRQPEQYPKVVMTGTGARVDAFEYAIEGEISGQPGWPVVYVTLRLPSTGKYLTELRDYRTASIQMAKSHCTLEEFRAVFEACASFFMDAHRIAMGEPKNDAKETVDFAQIDNMFWYDEIRPFR